MTNRFLKIVESNLEGSKPPSLTYIDVNIRNKLIFQLFDVLVQSFHVFYWFIIPSMKSGMTLSQVINIWKEGKPLPNIANLNFSTFCRS